MRIALSVNGLKTTWQPIQIFKIRKRKKYAYGERHRAVINNYLVPELENIDVNDVPVRRRQKP